MGDINQYRCIHLADYRENDKLCRAIERVKELEEIVKQMDNETLKFSNIVARDYIPKTKVRKILDKQYELFNSKSQKEYSQEVVDVLEELLEDK